MSYLEGKTVVITGGGSGIGRATGLFAGAHGARVVVNDIGTSPDGKGTDSGPAETVAAEIRAAGGEAVANTDSVADWDSAQKIIQSALDSFGKIDALINCAGVMRHAAFEKMTPEEFDLVVNTHLYGTWNTSRAAAPHFVKQGTGAFLHMTSTTGLIGSMGVANYGTAKGGIMSLSKIIAFDMSRHGNIRSNCMAPSATSRQWELINAFRKSEYDAPGSNTDFRKYRSTQGTNEQIAPVAAFLVSDAAADINGQIIGVRGNEVYLYSQPRPIRSIHNSEGWSLESLNETMANAFRPSLTPLETYGQVFSWPTM
ncbi:3-hydroxyacyl-CoA dehydrogenase [Oceanicola sp. 22II-s10i]|uniref:SDR family NAD(P)-dependent oxidoreductase n=1 Tax=Oceanicola sp. 22II-s10i TaxID=1317116 RepID=UPI000B52334B|nr:SDR family NAD(P)-dependent oxidoreductase [Oceanicola sp. 22II-s10i]OWU82936.1 3-hydroxyacyl-CoA dehydrogenase [Oceanicola sp. 22II-s10i]